MKLSLIKIPFITVLTILAVISLEKAYSQDSLEYYMNVAAKNNPTVLQKFSEYQAALQKVPQAGSLADPELNLGIFLQPMELVMGKQVADLRLMQMFPWFGTLRAAKDEMSLMANAKYESFRDAKLQVCYQLQQSWYELYKIRQNVLISEKNIEILRSIERLALIKFKTAPLSDNSSQSTRPAIPSANNQTPGGNSQGMGTMGGSNGSNAGTVSQNQPTQNMTGNSMGASSGGSSLSDIYRVQIEIGELENNIALLQNQQNAEMAKFNGFLNRSVLSPVAVADSLYADTLGISLAAVSDSMLRNNPMLGMLQYEQKSLESRKKMVTRMGYPMIGLGLNYTVINKNEMVINEMNGRDMIMPMLTVTLPIYRKKYTAMQKEADLLKDATAQNYIASANNLKTEYYQAIQLYKDAQRRIKLYQNQSMLVQKSLDILMRSFSVSGAGLTDILRLRQQNLDYDLKIIQATSDFNTAVAWLKRLMA